MKKLLFYIHIFVLTIIVGCEAEDITLKRTDAEVSKPLKVEQVICGVDVIGEELFSGKLGSGIESDPYQICHKDHIEDLALDNTKWGSSFYYKLMKDIDMSASMNFEPIGNITTSFASHFDGNYKTISDLSYSGDPAERYIGFFGYCNLCHLKNIIFDDVNMTSNWSSSQGYTGIVFGIADSVDASGVIVKNSRVSSASAGTNNDYVGLFSGVIRVNSSIEKVAILDSNYHITYAYHNKSGIFSGGINSSSVSQSFAQNIIIETMAGDPSGGFIGSFVSSSIENSYLKDVTGIVNGYSSGGFLGTISGVSEIEYSYVVNVDTARFGWSSANNQGAFAARSSGTPTFTKNFFASDQTNYTPANGSGSLSADAKTTVELSNQATYVDWDFSAIWIMDTGDGVPVLRWFKSLENSGLI